MWFSLGRFEGFGSQYPPNTIPVILDRLENGIIVAFVILLICFGVSLTSTDIKSNIRTYSRVFLQLLVGFLILLGNFGQDWEVSLIKTKTPYKAGIATEINATVGLHIGLRSINVTLESTPDSTSELKHEKIDYNERFSWTWDQGRFGFGPYAGRFQQEYRSAQLRGVPIPILWIVDYFVIDGEGFRYGRFYRTSGWYCHILLWAGFATWLLSVILLRSVIVYGGYCIAMTGICQLTANFVWMVVKNPRPLFIPYDGENLITHYGSSFWITLSNGLLCVIIAAIIVIMDYMSYDNYLYAYFDVDPLTSFDEISYLTHEEESLLRKKNVRKDDIPLVSMAYSSEEEDKVDYIPVYKKRGTIKYKYGSSSIAPPVISRSNKPKRFINEVV